MGCKVLKFKRTHTGGSKALDLEKKIHFAKSKAAKGWDASKFKVKKKAKNMTAGFLKNKSKKYRIKKTSTQNVPKYLESKMRKKLVGLGSLNGPFFKTVKVSDFNKNSENKNFRKSVDLKCETS